MFTTFIAGYARTYNDGFEFATGTPDQDEVVAAYIPFVKQSDKLYGVHREAKDREQMLALATKWDKAIGKGELRSILPVSFEDDIENGARGEVIRAKSMLVSSLLEDAVVLAKEREYKRAAEEALMATRLSESLKYSDFNNVYMSSVEQKKAGQILESIVNHLDEAERLNVRNGLALIKSNAYQLGTLTRYSRTQFYDWLTRMSKAPVSIEDVHRTARVTKRIVDNPSKSAMHYIRSTGLKDPIEGTNGPEYFSELRLAWVSEKSNQNLIDGILASL